MCVCLYVCVNVCVNVCVCVCVPEETQCFMADCTSITVFTTVPGKCSRSPKLRQLFTAYAASYPRQRNHKFGDNLKLFPRICCLFSGNVQINHVKEKFTNSR